MLRRASTIFAIFLLILPLSQPAAADHGVRTGKLQFDVELVITSYSIHYTKLYDSGSANRPDE